MLARLPRPSDRFVRVTGTLLALVTITAAVAAVLLAGTDATSAGLRGVSVLTGTAAASAFGLATLLVASTRRLLPGLWGYVPGLVCAVACGLAGGAV